MLSNLLPLAESIAEKLKARRQTIAVAESSAGGLISAALLAVPGASAYFLSGAVVYTAKARYSLMQLPRESVAGMRSAKYFRVSDASAPARVVMSRLCSSSTMIMVT